MTKNVRAVFKEFLDAVDRVQQAIGGLSAAAGALTPFLFQNSRTLAAFVAGGVAVGAFLGYVFTVSGFRGKARRVCIRRGYLYLFTAAITALVFAAAYVIIDPTFARAHPAVETLRDVLMVPMVFNFLAAGLSIVGFFFVVGAVTLTSSRLCAP